MTLCCTEPPSFCPGHLLQALTRKFCLAPDVDLGQVAEAVNPRMTGADLYGLCADAWMRATRRLLRLHVPHAWLGDGDGSARHCSAELPRSSQGPDSSDDTEPENSAQGLHRSDVAGQLVGDVGEVWCSDAGTGLGLDQQVEVEVCMADFMAAAAANGPSVSEEELERYEKVAAEHAGSLRL